MPGETLGMEYLISNVINIMVCMDPSQGLQVCITIIEKIDFGVMIVDRTSKQLRNVLGLTMSMAGILKCGFNVLSLVT